MFRRSCNGELKEDMAPLEKAEGGLFAKQRPLARVPKTFLLPVPN